VYIYRQKISYEEKCVGVPPQGEKNSKSGRTHASKQETLLFFGKRAWWKKKKKKKALRSESGRKRETRVAQGPNLARWWGSSRKKRDVSRKARPARKKGA